MGKSVKNLKRLNSIQLTVFNEYVENGYLKMWNVENKKQQKIFDIAELGLINSEVSEAMEIIRTSNNSKTVGYECADIIIRTLNFMTRKGLDAEYFIIRKHNKNIKRGKLHGKSI